LKKIIYKKGDVQALTNHVLKKGNQESEFKLIDSRMRYRPDKAENKHCNHIS